MADQTKSPLQSLGGAPGNLAYADPEIMSRYQRAQDELVEALTARKQMFDPTMLALARGFGAPTKTGFFSESLGNVAGELQNLQEAQKQEAINQATIRFQLAQQRMGSDIDARLRSQALRELGGGQAAPIAPAAPAGAVPEGAPAPTGGPSPAAASGLSTTRVPSDQEIELARLTNPYLAAALENKRKHAVEMFKASDPSVRQVAAEGIDPNSPAGISRVKELQAISSATPEMKMFAAQSGIPIVDPKFAAAFKNYEATKGLQGIAGRLGLDLANPQHLVLAQQEAQRDEFRKAEPEVAKALSAFGGDPLNPKDLARARSEVQQAIRLERESKAATIAQTRAQTERTKQEISDHMRTGDFGQLPEIARQNGVPLESPNKYSGMNRIEAIKKRDEEYKASSNYIQNKIAPLVATVDQDIVNLERAKALNKQLSTGMKYGIPGVGTVAKVTSGDKKLFDEFDALSALSAKANRIPGDSNVSNADMQWMRLGTYSSDKQPAANEAIINYQLEQRKRDRDYYSYLSNYAAVNGSLGPQAEAQWRKYLNANPLMVRDANGRVMLNPNKISYQEYFSMPRVQVDAQGREQR